MSFILDALRKSEAARRRSEAPDLFAHMPQAQPPPQAPPRWPWWALGIALAFALTIAVGLLTRRAQTPVAAAPAVETGDIADTSQAGADEVAAPQADATAEPEPARDQPPPPTQAVAAPPIAATPPPAPVAVATPPPAPPPAASQPAPPPVSAPVSAPATAPVATPAPPSSGDRIASPAELEPALRRELPALKLSMHLWNETPARRFIILDGQRLKEGDVLGEIVVERIDRDGAVLAWRGIRLRIE